MLLNGHSAEAELQFNHEQHLPLENPLSPAASPPTWWQQQGGLSFRCTGCGRCCSGDPGVVWLSQPDQEALAHHFGLDLATFLRRFCRMLDGKVALLESRRWNLEHRRWDYDCVLLEAGRFCRVYEARPTQCRTFPFWPENIESPETWQRLAVRGCEGIQEGEEKIKPAVIEDQLRRTLTVPGFDES